MNSGPSHNGAQTKKRGRPPGSTKGAISTQSTQKNTRQHLLAKTANMLPIAAAAQTAGLANHLSDGEHATAFSVLLRKIMHHNHTEITRVAKELLVTENTIYRWMNNASDPRTTYLKRLIEVLPEYRTQLIPAIHQTFGDVIGAPLPDDREVSKQVYQQVLEAVMTSSQDPDTRFWHVSEIIFNQALHQLDPNQHGLAITYAKLMPPHPDGIHSLREVKMRGHAPWGDSIDGKIFLGSTTLVGSTAVLQRAQDWNDADNGRAMVDIDSYERSAYAVPVLHGNLLAGVLVVSSNQSDFFKNPIACQLASEYALLMGVALSDHEFYSPDLLHLRPMPPLKWQRKELAQNYLSCIITYAHEHSTSRREAEFNVQQKIEMEFEEIAHTMLIQQGQNNLGLKQSHHVPFSE
jgi:hypothetical protein